MSGNTSKKNGASRPDFTDNPNELTIENSVLILIDHQPAVALNVHSIDLGLLVNNWYALTGEWAPYWASPARALVTKIDSQRGATTSALISDWIFAQVTAGVVPQPDFMSAAVPPGAR